MRWCESLILKQLILVFSKQVAKCKEVSHDHLSEREKCMQNIKNREKETIQSFNEWMLFKREIYYYFLVFILSVWIGVDWVRKYVNDLTNQE